MGLTTFDKRGGFGIECDWQALSQDAKDWIEDGEHDLIWYVPCHRIIKPTVDGAEGLWVKHINWQGAVMFANKADAVYFRMTWL